MSFNDDEPIDESQDVSGGKPATFPAGEVKVLFFCNPTAPLKASRFKVMLELTGAGSGNKRLGLDLVTVLDVSNSMGEEKLKRLKIAMVFMIKKLSPIDRLSIVIFNEGSKKLCPLRQITEKSQEEIETQVNDLVAKGKTNISAGLKMALKVLDGRKLTSQRTGGIMLMSDGQQTEFKDGDAAKVLARNVPVHTFGFGADHEPRVLKDIADNSMGGTFSDVQNQGNLSIAFSQCLAGLLTVAVQDLKLIVRKGDSTIKKVSAGNYDQSNAADGSVTVSFGDLYIKEVRKVMVDVLLDVVDSPVDGDALKYTYTYRTVDSPFDASPRTVLVRRTGRTSVVREVEEVVIEDHRLRTAELIKKASDKANNNELKDALKHLVEAQNLLDNVVYDESNPLIKMLKSELLQMKSLLASQEIYEKQGRPFALSSETSHNRQRFAARGDDVEKLRLFATPRMNAYLEQAKSFDGDPNMPLPSVDEDVKQELAADPLAPIDGALSYHTQTAIHSLKSIEHILNKAKSQPYKQELAANPLAPIVGDLRGHTRMASLSLKSIDDILNQAGRV